MSNRNAVHSTITLSILLITQLIIRSIGVGDISVQVFIAIIVIGCSLVIYGVCKDGKKGAGTRYNVISAILIILASVMSSITLVIIKCYPNLKDTYGKVFFIISLASYFAFVLFIIIYRIVYEVKRK
ncbi:hypothetical protein [Clostridium sp. C8-1-8]|uniref:hypothetical protein n=1 Tax=Clostridium sp. C8-1-8 TaxID=2698831 RepID=UPI00136D8D4A|nr:hypothetical protein [Clostridium sp. C8-1-8]